MRRKKIKIMPADDAEYTFFDIDLFGHLSARFQARPNDRLTSQVCHQHGQCIDHGAPKHCGATAGHCRHGFCKFLGGGGVRPQRAYKNSHFCRALRPRTGQPKRRPRAPGDAPGMTQIRPRAICSALAMPSGTQRLTPAPTPDTPKDIPDAPECSRDDPGLHFGCRWIQPAPQIMPKWISESFIFMFCRKNNKKHETIEISIENGLPGTRKSMKIQ